MTTMTTKRAFLVGINYKGSRYELHGCINDVISIRDVLISKYGYSDENILLLSDDTPVKPTASNIIEGWRWLISASPATAFSSNRYLPIIHEINFFFHYSGHGSQVADTNGDEMDGKDETICPIDFLSAGMITDDMIRSRLIDRVPSNCKLTGVIDACHSESSFDLLWTCKPSSPGYTLDKVGSYAPTSGEVIMLSGCRDDQTSADVQIENKGQGALTYALTQVLKQSDYTITYDKLLTDVCNYIRANKLSVQIPCLSFGKSAEIFGNFNP